MWDEVKSRCGRRDRRWISAIGLVVASIVVVGCSDSIDCCQDGGTVGAVTGIVVDGDQVPQPGVSLQAIDFQRDCQGWVAPGPFGFARSNDGGEFEMPVFLFLMRPAQYCFKIVMTLGNVADTTEQFQVRSFEESPPNDTTQVTLVLKW